MALNARRTTIIVISRTRLPKLGTSLNTNPRPQALVPTVHSVSGFDSSGGCTSVELHSGAVREGAANHGAESEKNHRIPGSAELCQGTGEGPGVARTQEGGVSSLDSGPGMSRAQAASKILG